MGLEYTCTLSSLVKVGFNFRKGLRPSNANPASQLSLLAIYIFNLNSTMTHTFFFFFFYKIFDPFAKIYFKYNLPLSSYTSLFARVAQTQDYLSAL